jgi:hypothetical protein
MRLVLFMNGLILLCSGCTSPSIQDEFAIYETVLCKQLQHEKSDAPFYLFVDGKDPVPDLLSRLQKTGPACNPVRKLREIVHCVLASKNSNGLILIPQNYSSVPATGSMAPLCAVESFTRMVPGSSKRPRSKRSHKNR